MAVASWFVVGAGPAPKGWGPWAGIQVLHSVVVQTERKARSRPSENLFHWKVEVIQLDIYPLSPMPSMK